MNTVEVALKLAIGDYMAKLGVAGQRTKQFGQDLQTAAQAPSKDLQKVGTAGLVMGGAVAAGFALAAHSALTFDKQMSEVYAVTGAVGEAQGQLRDAALEAGRATVFSAGEAAQAQAELAKAGLTTADILGGGLTGALDLAAAGGLDLATAAEIAANAMNQFNLDGSEVGHVADLLAAGANKSATDVTEMGMALKQGGAAAANMGIPLEETVGLLAVFAQNALKGSDGGTSMKTMLTSLAGVSGPARAAIKELGLEFFDASGEFLGLENAAEQLRLKLGPLSDEQRSQALNTIFGTDAARAAIAMMEGGGAAVRQWTDDVDQSGYAAQLAAEKNNNLAGDLEQLKGSIETALIEGGSQATNVLRGLTQGLESVVSGVGEMPAPVQKAFLGTTGLIGVGATAIGVYGTLAPKVEEVTKSLMKMGPAGEFVARNLGTASAAAGGLAIGVGVVAYLMGQAAQRQAEFNAKVDQFVAAMKEAGGATDDFNRSLRQAFADSDIGEILTDTSADLGIFTRGVRDSGTELDEWEKKSNNFGGSLTSDLRDAAAAGNELAAEIIRLADSGEISEGQIGSLIEGLDVLNDQVDTGAQKLDVENQMLAGLEAGADGAATATDGLTDSTTQHTEATEEDIKALEKQQEALLSLAGGHLGLQAAQIASRQALEEYNEKMADSTLTADEREQAGVDLLETYLREAEAAAGLSADLAEANGVQLTAADRAAIQKQKLEELAGTLAPGSPLRAQLQGYIDTLGTIKPDISTTVHLNTEEALRKAGTLAALYDRLERPLPAYMNPKAPAYGAGVGVVQADGGIMGYAAYANGGILQAERYANGGMRRGVAGIAPANSNVLFAETPATGDEAYIPLGSSKRQRSLAIWEETGRRLGADMGGTTVVNDNRVYEGDTIQVPVTSTSHSPYETAEAITFRRRGRGR